MVLSRLSGRGIRIAQDIEVCGQAFQLPHPGNPGGGTDEGS